MERHEMNLGVLLLYCTEGRRTSFTRNWADTAVGRVAAYYGVQSGGREPFTYQVFDWFELPISEQQWSDLGFGALASLKPQIEAHFQQSLAGFTHILVG